MESLQVRDERSFSQSIYSRVVSTQQTMKTKIATTKLCGRAVQHAATESFKKILLSVERRLKTSARRELVNTERLQTDWTGRRQDWFVNTKSAVEVIQSGIKLLHELGVSQTYPFLIDGR